MHSREQLREGMIARSADGEKLGKIREIGESQFIIEKGFFFPKDFIAEYSDIADVRGDEVLLRGTRVELETGEGRLAGGEPRQEQPQRRAAEGAVRLSEEELEIHKREREAGAVSLHKEVVTEEETVRVPVKKERVYIERSAAQGQVEGEAFKEESQTIPLKEEEVVVSKRPVVREEVRLKKEESTEEREITEPLRKERAEIRAEGDVEGPIPARGQPGSDPNKRE